MKSDDFDRILTHEILMGKMPVPNLKRVDKLEEASRLIATASGEMYAPDQVKLGEQQMAYYPKVFTTAGGMAGNFTGEGVIVSDDGVWEFTLCEHDWNTKGANPNRGWHPCRCRKCGFDASIDSGD